MYKIQIKYGNIRKIKRKIYVITKFRKINRGKKSTRKLKAHGIRRNDLNNE